MRKNSIKNTRINGEVQRELSNIIRGEIKDPRINPLTSVVAVEVAPDLKTCKAYISDRTGSAQQGTLDVLSHHQRVRHDERNVPYGNPTHRGRIPSRLRRV